MNSIVVLDHELEETLINLEADGEEILYILPWQLRQNYHYSSLYDVQRFKIIYRAKEEKENGS